MPAIFAHNIHLYMHSHVYLLYAPPHPPPCRNPTHIGWAHIFFGTATPNVRDRNVHKCPKKELSLDTGGMVWGVGQGGQGYICVYMHAYTIQQ
jgi:hypothetical protein